jgi:hypothetical protein
MIDYVSEISRSHDLPKVNSIAFEGRPHTYVKYNVSVTFYMIFSIHIQAERKFRSTRTMAHTTRIKQECVFQGLINYNFH